MRESNLINMHRLNVLINLFIALIILSGCSVDNEPFDKSNAESELSFTLKAKYKDGWYVSETTIDKNGDYVYSNKDYEMLMNEIDMNPTAQMVLFNDSTIYYYDDEDIKNNQPFSDIQSFDDMRDNDDFYSTRATGFENFDEEYLGFFALYDNDNFGGKMKSAGLTNFHFTYNLPNLKPHGLNDNITSIALCYNGDDPIVCNVLTIWEDTDYNNGDENRSKHRISIIASMTNPRVTCPDLKKIKKIGSSKSWNDCISSFSMHFGYIDRLLKDY